MARSGTRLLHRSRENAAKDKNAVMKTRGYVYMLANRPYGTIYIGVTTDLIRRVCEHYQELAPDSFTARYGVKRLVWYEIHADSRNAMTREKQLKKWQRKWKIRLIDSVNPYWRDLFEDIGGFQVVALNFP